jgi:molybdopterin synthase catalytic subunit
MYTAIVDSPIDVTSLMARVSRHGNGAILVFVGTVRDVNDGRGVTGMEYSAYRSMAERELAAIARETVEQFGSDDVAVEHRLGTLELGEASVAIAVGHPHRGAAYDASRYLIEQLKQRVQAACTDLEARALRRRHSTVGKRGKRRDPSLGS